MSRILRRYLDALSRRRFDVAGPEVVCWFGEKGQSRRHAVRLMASEDAIRFEATVVTARTLEIMSEHDDPHRWAWRRNRFSNLVGFRVDNQRRMVAEATAPLIGLSHEEFETYLRAVASEADRMELVLTAEDVQ